MSDEVVFGDQSTQKERGDTLFGPSLLDELRTELKAGVVIEPIRLTVETRPNISLRYHPDVDTDKISHWQRRSQIKGRKDELDPKKMARFVVMDTCTGIFLRGIEVTKDGMEGGEPVTLTDEAFVSLSGQLDLISAVDWLFGTDSQLLQHAARIMNDAGYNADGSALDADDNPLEKNSKH
jgi:hypothetical protein